MMRVRILAGLALWLAGVGCAGVGQAQTTIAQNTAGDGLAPSNNFYGQSFTPSGTGAYGNIVFSFQDQAGGNVGAGTLYLFSSQQNLAPSGLATATGALGSATYNGSSYSFAPTVLLSSGVTYYAYDDQRGFSPGYSTNNAYAGGNAFFSDPATGNSNFMTATNFDVNFKVSGISTASAVPEPATWSLLIAGLGVAGGTLRRRKKSSDSIGVA